ncbi:aspartate aminotransferase family protein [Nonomuraea rosea]|uniref:Aspartate aminotransferase family protein n=1 Tax=Nonomuraea rosea TaxID=638574 RepID=A0ABP6ZRG1_9ACTN
MWSIEEFVRAAGVTVEELAAYVAESRRGDVPVLARRPSGELAERLGLAELIAKGGLTAETYRGFIRTYLAEGTRLHHPAYLAHQDAAPDFPAALADFVHGTANNLAAVYEMGAPATTVELEVLKWMLAKVGFPRGGGVLTGGGSLANLTALLAARARAAPAAWDEGVPGDLVILAPGSAHYSVSRAASILGLGSRAMVAVETDALGRIIPARLPDISGNEHSGKRVMALVASACATGTGLHDDLRAIGEWCRARGVWFHVDAAHGASALLADGHRHLLDGIGLADSVIWDAHKMLATASLAAAVLVRDERDLDAAFKQEASYLFYGDQGFDLLSRTLECTKGELGLKIFLNLAWRGERGLGEQVSRRYAAAHRFWELARRREGFVLPYEPESNIVCFRYGDADQAALRERLMDDGSFYLTSTELGGVRHLRLTVMSPATDDATLESLLDAIEALV